MSSQFNIIRPDAVVDKWLVVVKVNGKGRAAWLCRCECGTERVVEQLHLRSGNSSSCGCSRRKARTHGRKCVGKSDITHNSWRAMIDRCSNIRSGGSHRYASRGISVCERWRIFENFCADMGDRPSQKHSLERKDYNGNYSLDNCVWATQKQQMRNMSRNRYLIIDGEKKLLCEWAEHVGNSSVNILNRIRRGWSEHDAILVPSGAKRPFATNDVAA